MEKATFQTAKNYGSSVQDDRHGPSRSSCSNIFTHHFPWYLCVRYAVCWSVQVWGASYKEVLMVKKPNCSRLIQAEISGICVQGLRHPGNTSIQPRRYKLRSGQKLRLTVQVSNWAKVINLNFRIDHVHVHSLKKKLVTPFIGMLCLASPQIASTPVIRGEILMTRSWDTQ